MQQSCAGAKYDDGCGHESGWVKGANALSHMTKFILWAELTY